MPPTVVKGGGPEDGCIRPPFSAAAATDEIGQRYFTPAGGFLQNRQHFSADNEAMKPAMGAIAPEIKLSCQLVLIRGQK